MFANTITLSIDSVDHVLNRVNQDGYGSEYQYNGTTSGIVLKIRHSTDQVDKDGLVMKRHNVYVERVIYPTPTTAMKKQSFTTTIRGDRFGDPADASDLAIGVKAWLSASTNQAILDLTAGIN